MHDNPIPGRAAEALTRGAEDAVLRRVLDVHPAHLTGGAVVLALVGESLELRSETYEAAIEALVADGLLRREGDEVHPTRAALRSEAVER
jgi:hypothetical protein